MNGYDAFQMVQKTQYDFIICDLNMPIMDGYQFAEQTRNFYNDKNESVFAVG